ncbi:PhoD-like phosphatase [Polystyrenella longa]|uniref:PhoD-like phosphatase n=1 Tax=Polystyrenella longa TaxID=2528007 RepID=A0A518CKC4_9PLAN|nr:alkaline phosphatase D family protein [Polystyrenella longa]QDU79667.1 PhoD-like phosphatase [Polystyrenella longa]
MLNRLAKITSITSFFLLCSLGMSSLPVRADSPLEKASTLHAGMGIMVGEVDSNSALVQLRLTETDELVDGDLPGAEGFVRFLLFNQNEPDRILQTSRVIKANADHDFITRVRFKELDAGTGYIIQAEYAELEKPFQKGPQTEFLTLPGAKLAEEVSFVVVTGMNYAKFHGKTNLRLNEGKTATKIQGPAYSGADKDLGFPALASILDAQPLFFVGTGDNVYYDHPKEPRARTFAEMRQKWHEQFVQPRFRDLFAKVPTYWEVDDHDYRDNDCDNSGDQKPTAAQGLRMMLEQLPYAEINAEKPSTYRTFRVSKDLQIWLVENRLFRSPNKMPDGPEKTIWGDEQKSWLKRTLKASDASFKILISPTPMVGPDDAYKTDNHANSNGFQHERDEFFQWVKSEKLDQQGFYIVCGDRHWQYHSIFPNGIEEISCGALVDANSRIGKSPGDPKSTDPEAKIKQPYTQSEPSGGYLLVRSQPATTANGPKLTFEWRDEHGEVLHEDVNER